MADRPLVVKRVLSDPAPAPTTSTPEAGGFSFAPPLPQATEADAGFVGGQAAPQPNGGGVPNPNGPTKSRDELRGTMSRGGEAYDPALHAWPASQTVAGKWRLKRTQRGAPPLVGNQTPTGMAPNIEFRKNAQQYADLYAHLNFVALGEGAEPKPEEVARVTDAIEPVLIRYGNVPMHPIVGLLAATSGYTFQVATREKVRKNGSWLRAALSKRFRSARVRAMAMFGTDIRTDEEKAQAALESV